MSAHRRTVPSETPSSRAACEVESPRRLTLDSVAMGQLTVLRHTSDRRWGVLHSLSRKTREASRASGRKKGTCPSRPPPDRIDRWAASRRLASSARLSF